jgi:cytochrome P450
MKLQYTEKVVKEALRLYPPAWIMSREALRDSVVGGYRVPAGTQLLISQWVMHRDPRFFDDPEEFRPDRWTDELTKRLPRYAYFPFGGGARICIGSSFAMMQTMLVLATVAQKFQMKPVAGNQTLPNPSLTLRPQGGVRVMLSQR